MGLQNTYQQVINNIGALFLAGALFTRCTPSNRTTITYPLSERLSTQETLLGNPGYLSSKQMTPGNHAYCVGFQDGTFPDMGWHIKGEMGGLWAHPIKLLDGFRAAVVVGHRHHSARYCPELCHHPSWVYFHLQHRRQNHHPDPIHSGPRQGHGRRI